MFDVIYYPTRVMKFHLLDNLVYELTDYSGPKFYDGLPAQSILRLLNRIRLSA